MKKEIENQIMDFYCQKRAEVLDFIIQTVKHNYSSKYASILIKQLIQRFLLTPWKEIPENECLYSTKGKD
jgi:hypothetical protein